MCSQFPWRMFLATLLTCLQWHTAGAIGTAEVGAFNRVSAFPVLIGGAGEQVSSPTEAADAERPAECAEATKDYAIAEAVADTLDPQEWGNISELSDPDSLQTPLDTARLKEFSDSLKGTSTVQGTKLPKPRFIPDPKRALWLSLVLPGAGQIYNRKYWKLPIVYGGFLGCAYALMWNQMMYRDYSQAYLDIMDDDPTTDSYMDMLPPRYDITGREEQFQTIFKRKKDRYRRWRDLSAFCFVGVYLVSVIDAYVDAQLSVFDISTDLSMSVEPAVIGAPNTLGQQTKAAYGLGCSLRF